MSDKKKLIKKKPELIKETIGPMEEQKPVTAAVVTKLANCAVAVPTKAVNCLPLGDVNTTNCEEPGGG